MLQGALPWLIFVKEKNPSCLKPFESFPDWVDPARTVVINTGSVTLRYEGPNKDKLNVCRYIVD